MSDAGMVTALDCQKVEKCVLALKRLPVVTLCSGAVRQADAGCCRSQRKRPGMEGSRGVERAPADNEQPASKGRREFKNKRRSSLSLVAKRARQHSAPLRRPIWKQRVTVFHVTWTRCRLCHCFSADLLALHPFYSGKSI